MLEPSIFLKATITKRVLKNRGANPGSILGSFKKLYSKICRLLEPSIFLKATITKRVLKSRGANPATVLGC
jgi:hypothetical protein